MPPTPTDMSDWWVFIKDYGTHGIILFGLALLIIGAAGAYARQKIKRIMALVDSVELLVKTVDSATCEAKADRKLFLEYAEIQRRLNSEDHWHHCPVDKCPHLGALRHGIEKITEDVREFSSQAQDSRDRTRQSIDTIMRRIDEFSTAVIAAFRNGKSG